MTAEATEMQMMLGAKIRVAFLHLSVWQAVLATEMDSTEHYTGEQPPSYMYATKQRWP